MGATEFLEGLFLVAQGTWEKLADGEESLNLCSFCQSPALRLVARGGFSKTKTGLLSCTDQPKRVQTLSPAQPWG